jgi:sigma-B regulation protein RsbU (phosphoserine phosphatase)
MQILLIEDDPGFTRYLREMVDRARDLSCQLRTAPDFWSGFASISAEPFDVVLLDLAVPDGAGLGGVHLIRATAPRLAIIVLGESDDEVLALEAVRAGAQDYLVKGQLTPGWFERSIRYSVERFQADLELLALEEKYQSIFDHLMEGIFRTTPDGRYLVANAALARIYGYSNPEELIDSLTDIERSLYVEPDRRKEFIRRMQEHDTITAFESQVHRKDGTIIWISENCRAVRDEYGTLLYYEGTVEDITLRRQTLEDLRNSEALYHSLVETLPQNIFRKDLEGRFTFANQQFCRSLGRKLEEIVGQTDFDFFPKELAELYQRDDRRILQTGKTYETVEEHQPPGGRKMYVHVVKTPLWGVDGRPFGLQGIFWDITQQREAERRLAQSQRELSDRNRQMQDDLTMAREIQLTMLPQQYPSFPRAVDDRRNVFEFTHRYLPSGTIGGDFFSVSALSDKEAAVFICDVAGHGVRSSLVTAMIRALVEELKPLARDPGQFLSKLNLDLHAILRHTGSPMLTTAFYMVAEASSGVIRYANAGHPNPLRISRSKAEITPLTNASGKSEPVLGLFEGATYHATEVRLDPRDLVMLFTDGICEVQNAEQALYSPLMLMESIRQHIHHSAPQLFDNVIADGRGFAESGVFTDDVCLVGMEFLPE